MKQYLGEGVTIGTRISLRALLSTSRKLAPDLTVEVSKSPAILPRMIIHTGLEVMLFSIHAQASFEFFEADMLNDL